MELGSHVAAVHAGVGEPAALLGEFRRSVVLVPVVGGRLLTASHGGIRWVFAFSDESALARFAASGEDDPGREQRRPSPTTG
ncbi:hypothetical protein [Streptomyces sp. SBT349]|uniref:hypothetical protein n=1 Tax=Streptomyces sp. SBT349 TaxID=1580539 RepID=UPI000B308FD7|nr:hypothetical protein [Streptomyces sp. SBT349]